ncbi:hypothetical protein BC829DRAFT_447949 [Chytridium lagenaria]|nr:hypothetical protein BC829DRAFT_447949 [Chytridium lagenaria]
MSTRNSVNACRTIRNTFSLPTSVIPTNCCGYSTSDGRLDIGCNSAGALTTLRISNFNLSFTSTSSLASLNPLASLEVSKVVSFVFRRPCKSRRNYVGLTDIEGEIPRSFERMTSLNTLFLQANGLTGKMRGSLDQLPRVARGLKIDGNLFTGAVPSWMYTLASTAASGDFITKYPNKFYLTRQYSKSNYITNDFFIFILICQPYPRVLHSRRILFIGLGIFIALFLYRRRQHSQGKSSIPVTTFIPPTSGQHKGSVQKVHIAHHPDSDQRFNTHQDVGQNALGDPSRPASYPPHSVISPMPTQIAVAPSSATSASLADNSVSPLFSGIYGPPRISNLEDPHTAFPNHSIMSSPSSSARSPSESNPLIHNYGIDRKADMAVGFECAAGEEQMYVRASSKLMEEWTVDEVAGKVRELAMGEELVSQIQDYRVDGRSLMRASESNFQGHDMAFPPHLKDTLVQLVIRCKAELKFPPIMSSVDGCAVIQSTFKSTTPIPSPCCNVTTPRQITIICDASGALTLQPLLNADLTPLLSLPNLKSLSIGGTAFSGRVPAFKGLTEFYAGLTDLEGEIPESGRMRGGLERLPRLTQAFRIDGNLFTGTVPDWVYELVLEESSQGDFDISNNCLSVNYSRVPTDRISLFRQRSESECTTLLKSATDTVTTTSVPASPSSPSSTPSPSGNEFILIISITVPDENMNGVASQPVERRIEPRPPASVSGGDTVRTRTNAVELETPNSESYIKRQIYLSDIYANQASSTLHVSPQTLLKHSPLPLLTCSTNLPPPHPPPRHPRHSLQPPPRFSSITEQLDRRRFSVDSKWALSARPPLMTGKSIDPAWLRKAEEEEARYGMAGWTVEEVVQRVRGVGVGYGISRNVYDDLMEVLERVREPGTSGEGPVLPEYTK